MNFDFTAQLPALRVPTLVICAPKIRVRRPAKTVASLDHRGRGRDAGGHHLDPPVASASTPGPALSSMF
jgi:hypothetical protein